jgi:hypothetical protein
MLPRGKLANDDERKSGRMGMYILPEMGSYCGSCGVWEELSLELEGDVDWSTAGSVRVSSVRAEAGVRLADWLYFGALT